MNEDINLTDKSWGLIGLEHFQCDTTEFFGSKVPFSDGINITIKRAEYNRDNHLGYDSYYPKEKICRIRLTPLQFADMLTRTNVGEGVPCTIEYTETDGDIKYTPMDKMGVKLTKYADTLCNNADKAVDDTEKLIQQLLADKKIGKGVAEQLRDTLRPAKIDINFTRKNMREDIEGMVVEAQASLRGYVKEANASLNSAETKTDLITD